MDSVYQKIIDDFGDYSVFYHDHVKPGDLTGLPDPATLPLPPGEGVGWDFLFEYDEVVKKDSSFHKLKKTCTEVDIYYLGARVYGLIRERLVVGKPLGFIENWLTDTIQYRSDNVLGMHDEDTIAREVLRATLVIPKPHPIDFTSDDQLKVADERRQFDEKFPGASQHYRGRYWRLFCLLLDRYLAEREKGDVFMRVEDWIFDEYDRMMEQIKDEDLPPVYIQQFGTTVFENKPDSVWDSSKYRRPSSKDGGRIVKAMMSYITERGLFGRQLAKRKPIEE